MVRWSWVSFQCRGVLLVWIRVGQGPTALAVGAGGGCLDVFALLCPFSPLSPLWETTRYRLKYCLKGSLSPKKTKKIDIKKKITLNYLKSAAIAFCSKGLKKEFETAVVNEPSVFEPLKFYCSLSVLLANSSSSTTTTE